MADLWTLWWVWLSAAIIFVIIEILLPSFLFLGFAIGAAVVAIILLLPVSPSLPALMAIFAGLSLVAWIGLRRTFRRPDGGARHFDHDIND